MTVLNLRSVERAFFFGLQIQALAAAAVCVLIVHPALSQSPSNRTAQAGEAASCPDLERRYFALSKQFNDRSADLQICSNRNAVLEQQQSHCTQLSEFLNERNQKVKLKIERDKIQSDLEQCQDSLNAVVSVPDQKRKSANVNDAMLAVGAELVRLADARWRSVQAACEPVALAARPAQPPRFGQDACKWCGELVWFQLSGNSPAGSAFSCVPGTIGFGRYPVTQADMAECRKAGACTMPDSPDSANAEPAAYVAWQDVEQYLAWVNQDLVPSGWRARVPRLAEWTAIGGGDWPPGEGDRRQPVQNLPSRAGIAVLPSKMGEWAQDCTALAPDGRCLVRKLFSTGRHGADRRDEKVAHWDVGFRIFVEQTLSASVPRSAPTPPHR